MLKIGMSSATTRWGRNTSSTRRRRKRAAGARHRGGQAPAHRHQRGIREGAETDRGKETADGAGLEDVHDGAESPLRRR